MAVTLFSPLKRILKRIISGSALYTIYLITTPKIKGMFGWWDESTDVIITQIIFAPFAIMFLGWILLAVSQKDKEK
tara:strand:- start:2182 stop:2409 length:228 start_codon:yes stop_codon:yes gene_type:complete